MPLSAPYYAAAERELPRRITRSRHWPRLTSLDSGVCQPTFVVVGFDCHIIFCLAFVVFEQQRPQIIFAMLTTVYECFDVVELPFFSRCDLALTAATAPSPKPLKDAQPYPRRYGRVRSRALPFRNAAAHGFRFPNDGRPPDTACTLLRLALSICHRLRR